MFKLFEVQEKDKNIIFNLMQLYTYELSFYEDETTHFELQENGLYKICDGKIAGFVLERFNEDGMNEIAEFFVLNKYRKHGAGTFMANEMFKKYKGKWEIKTLLRKKQAQEFWRKVVKDASRGNYEEHFIRDNTRYAFYFEN